MLTFPVLLPVYQSLSPLQLLSPEYLVYLLT